MSADLLITYEKIYITALMANNKWLSEGRPCIGIFKLAKTLTCEKVISIYEQLIAEVGETRALEITFGIIFKHSKI